jgi:acetoin utilization protein AcuB
MKATELIDTRLVAAKPEEKIRDAAIRFLSQNLGHIPVVEKDHLVGLLSVESMIEDNLLDRDCSYALKPGPIPQTHPKASLAQIFGPMQGKHLSVLPVVNQDEIYLGSISNYSWLNLLQEAPSLLSDGGIMILKMGLHDYMPSQIARIVESENARLIHLSCGDPDVDLNVLVMIKVNLTHLEGLRSAMERFQYEVTQVIQSDEMDEFLHDRWKNLENYLNI